MNDKYEKGSGLAGQKEFWKSYFCMQNHETTYTGPDIQKDIKFYYDFMYDISKIEKSIKKSLKEIDKTVADIMKIAGQNANDINHDEAEGETQETNPNPAAPAQTEQEESAVYSYLYQKWFTLNEDGILVELKMDNDEGSNKDGNNTNTSTATNVKNVASRDGVKDDDAVKGTDRRTVDTRCQNYAQCVSAMLTAKMSACEFIRNELMGIFRNHVQMYIKKDAPVIKKAEEKPAEEPKAEEAPKAAEKQTVVQRVKGAFKGKK